MARAAVYVAGVYVAAAAGFGFSLFWTSASAGLAEAGAEVAGFVSSVFVYAPSFICLSFEIDGGFFSSYFDSAPSFLRGSLEREYGILGSFPCMSKWLSCASLRVLLFLFS